jgi:site-specific DNA-cytosine methylase
MNADFTQFKDFDLLIAGTCCQSLSKTRAEDSSVSNGLDGKSKIFWEYVRALKTIKPSRFMLENVVPKDMSNLNIMSAAVGIKPMMINSNLFSAQDRERYYWTNIPIAELPKSNSTVLKDIMEPFVDEKYYYNKPFTLNGKDKKVCATLQVKTHEMLMRVYNPGYKCATLTCVSGGYQEKKVLDGDRVRKLTPIEYERLQTLPDNFTYGYKDTVRYTLCGNGWTKEVIKHIFKGLQQ